MVNNLIESIKSTFSKKIDNQGDPSLDQSTQNLNPRQIRESKAQLEFQEAYVKAIQKLGKNKDFQVFVDYLGARRYVQLVRMESGGKRNDNVMFECGKSSMLNELMSEITDIIDEKHTRNDYTGNTQGDTSNEPAIYDDVPVFEHELQNRDTYYN